MKPLVRNTALALACALIAAGLLAVWPGAIGDRGATYPGLSTADPLAPAGNSLAEQPPRAGRASMPSRAHGSSADLPIALAETSLRGSDLDGQVRQLTDGRVVPDAGLKRLFDHLLSLYGEADLMRIRAHLNDMLVKRYGPVSAQQALDWFDLYSVYLQAVAEVNPAQITDPRQRLARVKALRRQWLGEEMAEGFFSDEEALADYSLKRMEIARDTTLPEATRRERLQQLTAALPAELRAVRDDALTTQIAEEQAQRFERGAVDEAARLRERTALWGAEAAQRLAALDRENAAWDQRVADYIGARDKIRADASLNAELRNEALNQLRSRAFTPPERRRVEALEAIGQLGRR
jgi:lipase chaperone LimK